jgi:hypothetical protein
MEARLPKKKLSDIEEAEKLKQDSELKAHIVRARAVPVVRLYAKILLAVSVLVSITILIGGVVMAASGTNPYGPCRSSGPWQAACLC